MHKFLFYNKFIILYLYYIILYYIILYYIILYYGQTNVLQKVQMHVTKYLNKKFTTENAIITRVDKGKTIVNSNEYSEKVHFFLTVSNFNILTEDPTDKFHKFIHKALQKVT